MSNVRCWNCGNDFEVVSSAENSNKQHTPILPKPDTGVSDEDVEYWIGYNNGYTDGITDNSKILHYKTSQEDLDVAYWQGYNNAITEMSSNDDNGPDVVERRQ